MVNRSKKCFMMNIIKTLCLILIFIFIGCDEETEDNFKKNSNGK
jgi:uncharacterized lipoprotein YehR (DUF1307 family)